MKVICTIKGASELINSTRFVSHADGMISEEIDEDTAAVFLDVPGFKVASSSDDEIIALRARAAELGVKVDSRWKAARLKTEIEAAEADSEEHGAEKSAADHASAVAEAAAQTAAAAKAAAAGTDPNSSAGADNATGA